MSTTGRGSDASPDSQTRLILCPETVSQLLEEADVSRVHRTVQTVDYVAAHVTAPPSLGAERARRGGNDVARASLLVIDAAFATLANAVRFTVVTIAQIEPHRRTVAVSKVADVRSAEDGQKFDAGTALFLSLAPANREDQHTACN